jgi:hypothetical protein
MSTFSGCFYLQQWLCITFGKNGLGYTAMYNQGDQTVRIFVQWVIAFFGHFSENTEVSRVFRLLFIRLMFCVSFDKKVLGRVLGDFLTNPSGHPAFMRTPADVIMTWN